MNTPHPLIDSLLALYFREGYPFTEADRDIERMRLAFEWTSGQWVMLTDKATDRLWGWASWWRVSQELLDKIRAGDIEEHVRTGNPAELLAGPCAYIATTIVAPYAPPGTYRRLFDLVADANSDAVTLAAHIKNRRGVTHWVERDYHEGKVCLSAKANNRAQARL